MDPERATSIRLLCLDVDGVLTDGRIMLDADGREIKTFHVQDGMGIRLWLDAGHDVAIITSRSSEAVTRRAAELGIEHVHQGCRDKMKTLQAVLDETGCTPDETAAVGDDLPDMPMLKAVTMPVAVNNAVSELKAIAVHTTTRDGGHGAVRELIEDLLRAQGRWDDLVAARSTPLLKG